MPGRLKKWPPHLNGVVYRYTPSQMQLPSNLDMGRVHTGFLVWGGKSIGASTKRGNVRGLGHPPSPGPPEKFWGFGLPTKSRNEVG